MATTEETRRTTSVQVRDHLVDVLARDLVGAEPTEVLSVAPSRWYLTGFLVPHQAPIDVREDPDPEEGLANEADEGSGDDAAPPEIASARKAFFPSSIGLSVLVPASTRALAITSAAAQEENIEAGVLIKDRLFALTLGRQFDDLVSAGQLVPVHGLARGR